MTSNVILSVADHGFIADKSIVLDLTELNHYVCNI